MNSIKLLFAIALLNIGGCGMTQVVEWDGDEIPQEEQDRIMGNQAVEYSEDIVTLATESKIAIVASKNKPTLIFYNDYKIKQDHWNIDAHNLSDDDQCVALQWKLMDFKFVSDHPTLFYVPKRSITHVGIMTQMVWEIQGVKFAPEGSGFIWSMGTREPAKNAESGEECSFILQEEDLRKEKDVYVH